MARYADVDKLIWQVQNSDKYGTITKQVFISLLQNSETEDVAPVIHAHWALYLDENNCTYGNYACTNCHTIQGLMKYRYCPYCGAKMDEEVE